MPTFSLIVSRSTALPSALTGVALRFEKFTVTKMSTSRWLIEIPDTTLTQLAALIDALDPEDTEIHEITP
jgi:hypothetical protein